MSELPNDGTRLSDEQVAWVLRRAAELQQSGPLVQSSGAGIAPAELVQIGSELGLDPECLRTAISEVETDSGKTDRVGIIGGPTRVEANREFAGDVGDDGWESIIADFRRTLGKVGQTSMVGGVREWTGGERELDAVHVSLKRGNGKVRLRATSDMTGAAFLIGFLMIFPVILGCQAIASASQLSIWAQAFSMAAVVGLAFFILRTGYTAMCKRRKKAIQGLLARAEAHLEKNIEQGSSEHSQVRATQDADIQVRLNG